MHDPFADPEVQAAMKAAGIVHRPGQAEQMLEQLMPLLLAEGVDFDDPYLDLDKANEALGLAVERHNLELSTPVGQDRELALAVLSEFTRVFSLEGAEAAQQFLTLVPSDPLPGLPTVAQVIGVSLGLLDSWCLNRRQLEFIAEWYPDKAAYAAAQDALKFARAGEAFSGTTVLIRVHAGRAVLHGAALAVSSYLIAAAEDEGVSIESMASRLLGAHRAGLRRQPASPRLSSSARRMVKGFQGFLEKEGTPSEALDGAMIAFRDLIDLAGEAKLDLRKPTHVASIVDRVLELEDELDVDAYLYTLEAYTRFRISLGVATDLWTVANATVTNLLGDELGELLYLAMSPSGTDEETVAVADLPVVKGIGPLLDWIGKGQPLTDKGSLRRADIERVAGFIGIAAKGVNSRSHRPTDHILRVRSMTEIPTLAIWWEALLDSRLIEVKGTRVLPGDEAESGAFDEADLRAGFVVDLGVLALGGYGLDDHIATLTMTMSALELLMSTLLEDIEGGQALAAELAELPGTQLLLAHGSVPSRELLEPFRQVGIEHLRELATIGLLRSTGTDRFTVPGPLRGIVARIVTEVRESILRVARS